MSLKIEIVPLAQLSPDLRNARRHSETNISAIAGSLRQFGQRKPIVVTAENVVVAGNGTLEAARSLGWSDIAIVRIPNDWSSAQIMAFALADNRTAELAEWDVSVLDDELQELIFSGFNVEDFGFAQTELPPENDWSGLADAVKDRSGMQQMTFNLSDDQVATVQEALSFSKSLGAFDDSENVNSNGNALARVCEMFLGFHGR